MKHTVLSLSLTLVLLLSVTACESVLDQEPISQFSDDQFWKTPKDAELGVASIYDAMQEHYRTRYYLWGEFRADNFGRNTITGGSDLTTNQIGADNAPVLQWDRLYKMISRANLAIAKVPTISKASPTLLGEAHILRAYAYFDAIRVWGAVPLFTEPVLGFDNELLRPRTDANQILNQVVIPDMLKAETLVSATPNQFRFTRASVWAFQASVYLYLKDYEKAKIALDKIIATKSYTLVTDRKSWREMFLNDEVQGKFEKGTELILSIQYDLLTDGGATTGGPRTQYSAAQSPFLVSALVENKWIAKFPVDSISWNMKYPKVLPPLDDAGKRVYGDFRYFESRLGTGAIGTVKCSKYEKTTFAPPTDDTDIPIFRYASILLWKAEVENKLSTNKTAAIDLINQIRVARQLPRVLPAELTATSTTDQVENFILDERQLELFAEGQRWWDLVRTGKVVSVMGPINGQTEPKIVLPIWEGHLRANPLLTQNEAYR